MWEFIFFMFIFQYGQYDQAQDQAWRYSPVSLTCNDNILIYTTVLSSFMFSNLLICFHTPNNLMYLFTG